MARYAVVDALEKQASETVAAQLADMGAPPLDTREGLLVLLGIRAGIAATRPVTGDGHG